MNAVALSSIVLWCAFAAHLWLRHRPERKPALVIAFAGLPGAGKDTAADLLVDHHSFQKLSFATRLRDASLKAAQYLMGCTDAVERWFYDREQKETSLSALSATPASDLTPRDVMKYMGCEIVRDPDTWARLLLRDMHAAYERGQDRFAISDLRFPNEIQRLREQAWLHCVTVRIVRPGDVPSSHASDTALDGHAFDFEIENVHAEGKEALHLRLRAALSL